MSDQNFEVIKRINISGKRQITIPKRFYDKLGLKKEIICELKGDKIILRNTPHTDDRSEDILKNLVEQGFEGEMLIQEFQKQKTQNRTVAKQAKLSGVPAKNQHGKVDEQIKVVLGNLKKR